MLQVRGNEISLHSSSGGPVYLRTLEQRFLTFFYLSIPFGDAEAVQHPLPLTNTWLL